MIGVFWESAFFVALKNLRFTLPSPRLMGIKFAPVRTLSRQDSTFFWIWVAAGFLCQMKPKSLLATICGLRPAKSSIDLSKIKASGVIFRSRSPITKPFVFM